MGAVVEYGRPAEGKGTTLVPEPNVRTECRRRTSMRIVQLPHLPRCLAHQGQVPTFDLDRAKPLSLQRAYRSHDVAERLRLVELSTHITAGIGPSSTSEAITRNSAPSTSILMMSIRVSPNSSARARTVATRAVK